MALAGEFPPYSGGVATYALCMAQAATELGADVTIVAPDYGNADHRDDDSQVFRVVRFPGAEHKNKDLPAKTRLAYSAVRREPYDLVHAMDWAFFIPVALTARSSQRRLFTVHGTDANDMARPKKRMAVAAARVFSPRSEVIANSDFTLSLLRARFPNVRPRSLRYEHLGILDYWRAPVDRSNAVREKYRIRQGNFVMITVGRLVPRKGQAECVTALAKLPEAIRDRLTYLIVGSTVDSAYAAKVDAAVVSAGFDARRLANIDNEALRELYANSDAFCLVGRDVGDGSVEGFGLVFLEGAAQGLPCVAGDVGAVREVVLDGVSGIMVPSEDDEALRIAVTRLMQDGELRSRLGRGARDRALDFSWKSCAANTYRALSDAS